MRYCWKNWIVVFIALWLPLQGYGAVAMPFCEHGKAASGGEVAVSAHLDSRHFQDADAGMHHEDNAAGHEPAQADGSMGSADNRSAGKHGGLGCNDCGACQLACAPLIISATPAVAGTASPVYAPRVVHILRSVTPRQLQRPPLAALI
jgi:hypothetical protein